MNSSLSLFGSSVPPIGIGFGTAGLGGNTIYAVTAALSEGFRNFDTAEASWWYDQEALGQTLQTYFSETCDKDESCSFSVDCASHSLRISTKIPPWELKSASHIRQRASNSRQQLVGFCNPISSNVANPFRSRELHNNEEKDNKDVSLPYPLDVYYIHAPQCWDGWHPDCDGVEDTLGLREAWLAMEAVVGIDHSAARIGLSNIDAEELQDIVEFVKERNANTPNYYPPPRMPDVVQIYADPFEPALELRQLCEQYGIEFVSYSTLGSQHMRYENSKNPVLENAVIQRIAKNHGRSAAEVVLSWAIQNRMSVIPRSSKESHIKELAKLLYLPPFLTDDEVQTIDSLHHRKRN